MSDQTDGTLTSLEPAEDGVAEVKAVLSEGEKICPPCGKAFAVGDLVRGVCPRCLENFKAKHKGKLEVKWTAADSKIPKSHYVTEATMPSGETEFEVPIERDDEKALEVLRRLKIGLNYCYRYTGNAKMAMYCFALAMGFRDVTTNAKGQVLTTDEEIGGLFGVEKASVGKCKLDLQARMGIEPLDGQRTKAARAKMKEAREKQLKRKTK